MVEVTQIRLKEIQHWREEVDLWSSHLEYLKALRATFLERGEATDIIEELILGVESSLADARQHIAEIGG